MISPLVSPYPPLSAAALLLFSPFSEVRLVNVCRLNCKENQSAFGEINCQTIYLIALRYIYHALTGFCILRLEQKSACSIFRVIKLG